MQGRGSRSWLHGSLHHTGSAGGGPRFSTHPTWARLEMPRDKVSLAPAWTLVTGVP